jgi:hypothetical protein
MKLAAKTITASAAVLIVLTACSENAGSNGGTGDDGEDPVFAAMKTWDACEVLDNLQPLTEYMGIEGWGSTTASGGEPQTREYDSTWYPDSIGCGNLISLGESAGSASGGEVGVGIAPAEGEDQAAAAYAERVSSAESTGATGQNLSRTDIGGPWDEGVLISWLGSADGPHTQVIARDGQWVFFVDLDYDKDLELQNTGTPSYNFTEDELHQWLTDTYLPEVNQAVNDKIAEVK